MKRFLALVAVVFFIFSGISYALLKEDLKLMISSAPQMSDEDLAKVSRFLPVSVFIEVTDTDENLYVSVGKDGKPHLYDSLKKVDVKITSDEKTYREFLSVNSFDQKKLIKYIGESKIDVEPKSYRSKILFKIIEDKFDVKLTKNKSVTDSIFVFLPAKFLGMFIK